MKKSSGNAGLRHRNAGKQKAVQAAAGDIAVIGMACRFPGAPHYEAFWENLKRTESSIREIPADRWDWRAFWGDPAEVNKSNSKWGGFIDDVDAFDPRFFGISVREAESMDPQQRIMLELSWSCLEDAGIRPSSISGENVGVYLGLFNFDYKELQEKEARTIDTYHSTGTASAVIPNRISHYFNFRGPSLPIDTACSGSLNAIHAAMLSLNAGECTMALAGGISLLLTPTRHISFSKTGMLSPTGACKTFDENADGYVRGEGAGLILLKPLMQALKDGDFIYGVLKGSAINHNGKTHTLTYPNAEAQAEVISEAYRRAGVSPETVSYIEAHGTGTPKGDPLEFRGLVAAFERLAAGRGGKPARNYCALGSVKTNIGHLESAAGIAGVIKVLLALQHKQLPGLRNFTRLNHRISIKDTPFYMLDGLREWKPLREKNRVLPRRAGVSSFGFGGTNAHLVLEEAPTARRRPRRKAPCSVICLSAKTEEALQRRERDLSAWLEKADGKTALDDIAAMLLHGREHFEVRSAFVAKNLEELRVKLRSALDTGQADGYFRSKSSAKGKQAHREPDRSIAEELRAGKLNARNYRIRLSALAERYVNGQQPDWAALSPDRRPMVSGIPTYPFARERYWLQEKFEASPVSDALHPLLHKNISNFSHQQFSSRFSGNEFYLADHVVKGERFLPGVAYLELAYAAIRESAGQQEENKKGIRLQNVVWARPLVVKDMPLQARIMLDPAENGTIAFAVLSSGNGNDQEEPIVHSRGTGIRDAIPAVSRLDLSGLTDRCRNVMAADQCYAILSSRGLAYGPGHRGIEAVYAGAGEVLAKLALPPSVSHTRDRFVLHPSIMDSALQASLLIPSGDSRLALPFALEGLDVHSGCGSSVWAWVRPSAGGNSTASIKKFDIDIADEQGNVTVRMKGLLLRAPEKREDSSAVPSGRGTLLFEPVWIEKRSDAAHDRDYEQRLAILCGPAAGAAERIRNRFAPVRCVTLEKRPKDIEKQYEEYTAVVIAEIQTLLKTRPKGRVLTQIVIDRDQQQLFTGLSGLLKTARLENPNFIGQLIEIEHGADADAVVLQLQENSSCPGDAWVRYRDGKRSVASWQELNPSGQARGPWRENGVYLITGGAGGLGLIFAEEIARNAPKARIILAGRSPLSHHRQGRLREIRAVGAEIEYRPLDVGDKRAVQKFIRGIGKEFGSIHGIIHAAGLIRDNFIIKKTRDEIQAVLAPKVTGLLNLDHATRDMELDFFVCFSSFASGLGNIGQADYAAANGFLDAYVRHRNALVAQRQRNGRSLSINWPLWNEGGMRVDQEIEKEMMRKAGFTAMPTRSGLQAFSQALNSGRDQVLVMEGDRERIRSLVLGQAKEAELSNEVPEAPAQDNGTTPIAGDALREDTIRFLKKVLSSALRLPVDRIDAAAPMEKYGIDSIMAMQMTTDLEKVFGSLSKTLFFEYQTIQALSEYFLDTHRGQLAKLLGMDETPATGPASGHSSAPVAEPALPHLAANRRFRSFAAESPQEERGESSDIAVIGVSGRYPRARNLREFWKNLREGRDCISEVPKDRWDHDLYFDEDRTRPGKTYSKWGGFLEGVDLFDPLFFNISPREAELMDPQERLFLQCVYETLEDAGYAPQSVAALRGFGPDRSVGVYVGVMWDEYQLYAAQEQGQGRPVSYWGIPSSIANRVSYFCNFHGPSMAVDTMCSSSLTAIHLACQSLQRGGCDLAIAGGVNVSIHPNKYLFLAQGGFISGKGRCESFGVGGDGYVPGEGVGAVLLKPLSRAIADGDHVYGIIKATAVNHGGKTNGYTVPNPHAQAAVISRAIRDSGIDPRTISYLEAHGTGTSLGDPIEIAGLARAFGQFTKDKQFCSIGSAKSNIGHCESAAGIAGVTKVLLQLKHEELAPSLHAGVLNPHIDFANTPFVVQQELAAWKRPVLGGRTLPRRAGVSSFGAGGSNAHVIIEEYAHEKEPASAAASNDPAIITLSARNEERLREQAQRLAEYLEHSHDALEDIAFTLQTGRDAMHERLAFAVSSRHELREIAGNYAQGRAHGEDVYRAHAKGGAGGQEQILEGREGDAFLKIVINERKHSKLCRLWVQGAEIDWTLLHAGRQPRRISLPTYPFTRERCWNPASGDTTGGAASRRPVNRLHPLLHENVATLREQKFNATFTGQEFFLRDHVIGGRKLLPGVAYIEMVRKAAELAAEKPVAAIERILWASPIAVDERPEEVTVSLYPRGDVLDFEVHTAGSDGDRVLKAQGKVVPGAGGAQREMTDIEEIKRRCGDKREISDLYSWFEKSGFHYGPGFRSVRELFCGDGEALSVLEVPSTELASSGEYTLHPSLMDGALQTTAGLGDSGNGHVAYLPFATGRVEIAGPVRETCHAWVRATGRGGDDSGIKKYDVTLLNQQGEVLVRIRDFTLRAQTPQAGPISADSALYYKAEWERKDKDGAPEDHSGNVLVLDGTDELRRMLKARGAAGRIVLVKPGDAYQEIDQDTFEIRADEQEDYRKALERLHEQGFSPDKVIHAWALERDPAGPEGIGEQLRQGVFSLFFLSKALLAQRTGREVRLAYVYSGADNQPAHAAASGLAKTIRLENSRFKYSVVEVQGPDAHTAREMVLDEMNGHDDGDIEIRYVDGKRYVKQIGRLRQDNDGAQRFKEKGVYIITGGAGGLGLIFAEYLARTCNARLVLTGRTGPALVDHDAIRGLERAGAEVLYVSCDVTDREQVKELIGTTRERFGEINGIIHGAGLIRDSLILNKTREEMLSVLGPKIYGTVNLDEETKNEDLDVFVLFSSITAVLGNVGQCDYAVGNAFMDSFAEMKNREGRTKTVSINWPLWRDGGMRVNEQAEIWLKKNWGMVPLKTEKGVRAFEDALSAGETQVIVLDGEKEKIEQRLGIRSQPASARPGPRTARIEKAPGATARTPLETIERDLTGMVSELLKVRESDIDREEGLESYGIDSIAMMKLMNLIEEAYGASVEPNSIVENNSIQKLAAHLMENGVVGRQDPAQEQEQEGAAEPVSPQETSANTVADKSRRRARFIPQKQAHDSPGGTAAKIAVIGMACRFPEATSVEDFWDALRGGRNCIREIPEDRWDIGEYFSTDRTAENSSYSKWGGFLPDIYSFDAEYFGIKDDDAIVMDPQHRIMLELSEELLCRAGYGKEDINGTKTGVFIGGADCGYAQDNKGAISGEQAKRMIANTIPNMMASRVSDYYNLTGSSLTMDTACSSALVALHQACSSIRSGECSMAIAGGIQLLINESFHVGFSKAEVLSDDGCSYVFDERANGFVLGEGAGIVLLKPYEDAVRDGDRIYAVILGSAVNNDGHTMGLTVPNMKAQSEVVQRCLETTGVSAAGITYLEAHGTGTLLGDPIEIRAAGQVYGSATDRKQYCAVGSVKSNIGHLLRAAGAASFIKVVLSLQHKTIPPTLHCARPHPRFKFEESPFYPITRPEAWAPGPDGRRAAISSFGFGGTNCHMILEEFTGEEKGYLPGREPLPLPQFKRRQYRLGQPVVDARDPFGDGTFMEMLERLENGEIEVAEAMELIRSHETAGSGR